MDMLLGIDPLKITHYVLTFKTTAVIQYPMAIKY